MTSGEYAYDLLRRLQRNFRCTDSGDRMYLYNFFGEIFNDPSVTITKEAHDAFIAQMDSDSAYYAEKGLTSLSSIYRSDGFATSWSLLKNSFSSIGITIECGDDGSYGWIDFTLPDGKTKRLTDSQGLSSSYLCSRTGAEYEYAKAMMPYYEFANDEIKDFSDIPTNVAGYGTYWAYDGSGTLEISGLGSMVSSSLYVNLGIRTDVKTVMVGAGISRLMSGSLYFPNSNMNFVFLHGSADDVQADENVSGTSTSEEISYYYNIYTDCEAIKRVIFQPNISVTFHALSEWDG